MKISLIAAIGKNRELGKDNKLLFDIPKDMAHFKEKTSGHAVIMGRKTFESIGRPLPNRNNIVITHDTQSFLDSHPEYGSESRTNPGATVEKAVSSVEEALELGKQIEKEELFIIGGAQIYNLALPLADKLYLTLVDSEVKDADAFFPEYENYFKKIISLHGDEENGFKFAFIELEK